MFANVLARFIREEEGASLVEYGLLVALIAAVCIGTVALLGTSIKAVFTDIADKIVVPGS